MVKNILKNEHIELNVEQRFTKESSGTFRRIKEDEESENSDIKPFVKVRPTEYQTFLKVGSSNVSTFRSLVFFFLLKLLLVFLETRELDWKLHNYLDSKCFTEKSIW